MNIPQSLRERINFQGDFDELLKDVAASYHIGDFISFEPMMLGVEDVNLKLTTSDGTYLVKIFADSRDDAQCLRLINVVKTAIENGISHPQFLKREHGYIFRGRYEEFNIRVAVFEFIEGKTFYELKKNPTTAELKEIIRMASLGNSIGYRPLPLYDSWSLVNFTAELELARKSIDDKYLKILDALQQEFEKVDIAKLPHSLVHGDLISTNIIKAKDGAIYFLDFSVANYYPRIVELAVLMCDVMFDPSGTITVEKYYKLLLSEYQSHIKLNEYEIEVLPLFIKLAHAMHVVRASREIKEGNKSEENLHWLELGKKGLTQTLKAFN